MLLFVVGVLLPVPLSANQEFETRYPKNTSPSQDMLDLVALEDYGAYEMSLETKNMVLSVAKELNIEKPPRMRKANPSLMKNNAAIVVDCLFIDEQWFNTLPENQKRALIGHELIHYKNHHTYKKVPLILLAFAAASIPKLYSWAVSFGLNKNDKAEKIFNSWYYTKIGLLFSAALAFQSRKLEREADIESAKQLSCAKDSIELMKKLKKNEPHESRFKIKRDFKAFVSPILRFFYGTHPTTDERIEYLSKL